MQNLQTIRTCRTTCKKEIATNLQLRTCHKKNDLQNCVILPDDTNGPPGNAEI